MLASIQSKTDFYIIFFAAKFPQLLFVISELKLSDITVLWANARCTYTTWLVQLYAFKGTKPLYTLYLLPFFYRTPLQGLRFIFLCNGDVYYALSRTRFLNAPGLAGRKVNLLYAPLWVFTPSCGCLGPEQQLCSHLHKIINEPVFYMVLGPYDFAAGKDITWAIGRGGP